MQERGERMNELGARQHVLAALIFDDVHACLRAARDVRLYGELVESTECRGDFLAVAECARQGEERAHSECAVSAAEDRTEQTKGLNRNTFKTTASGNRSTCSIRAKDGGWIALTRDWTAR